LTQVIEAATERLAAFRIWEKSHQGPSPNQVLEFRFHEGKPRSAGIHHIMLNTGGARISHAGS
jgi:hypothetical protein